MPVPDTTSAEAVGLYPVGKKIAGGEGPAWRDVKVSVLALPAVSGVFTMPATAEPLIVLVTSGEAEAQERENGGLRQPEPLRAVVPQGHRSLAERLPAPAVGEWGVDATPR